MRWLLAFEILSILSFGGFAAAALLARPAPLPTIEAAALAAGPADETWTGIFIEGQHIGYAVNREARTADGGRVYQSQSVFKVGSMGDVQQVVTAGTALTGPDGHLVRFDFLLSSPVRIVGAGEVREGSIHLELSQAGQTQALDIPITSPPTLSMTLSAQMAGRSFTPGQSFEVPYFDPITMSQAPMKVFVESTETLGTGDLGYWLRTSIGSMTTRRLVDAQGATLREESEIGFSAVRMTKADALKVDTKDPPDLVALASVPVVGLVERGMRSVALKISGVDASRVPDEPGWQARDGNVVRVTVPDLAQLPTLPVAGEGDTNPTPFLPATNAEIIAKAVEVVGDAPNRKEAARRLNTFVFEYVAKVPTIGVPNGLEVLHSMQGDCNEHTALYVSLARAAGIPSRIAAGLVWSDRLGDAFYYHAWPEVLLGDGTGGVTWVAVDPTFGQFPADATHMKLVTGDLDRQVEIMGVMGRIRLEVTN